MSTADPRVGLWKFGLALAVATVIAVILGVVLPVGAPPEPRHPLPVPHRTPLPVLTGPPFLPTG
jgi:hypothetical protein